MSTFFLDVWTFALSQIGLVALGVLFGAWLSKRGYSVIVLDEDDVNELLDEGEVLADE